MNRSYSFLREDFKDVKNSGFLIFFALKFKILEEKKSEVNF
jgi:hypothetical protein